MSIPDWLRDQSDPTFLAKELLRSAEKPEPQQGVSKVKPPKIKPPRVPFEVRS